VPTCSVRLAGLGGAVEAERYDCDEKRHQNRQQMPENLESHGDGAASFENPGTLQFLHHILELCSTIVENNGARCANWRKLLGVLRLHLQPAGAGRPNTRRGRNHGNHLADESSRLTVSGAGRRGRGTRQWQPAWQTHNAVRQRQNTGAKEWKTAPYRRTLRGWDSPVCVPSAIAIAIPRACHSVSHFWWGQLRDSVIIRAPCFLVLLPAEFLVMPQRQRSEFRAAPAPARVTWWRTAHCIAHSSDHSSSVGAKFFCKNKNNTIFVCIWQILSNYVLTRLKRSISSIPTKMCN